MTHVLIVRHNARPWTINGERASHWRKHRALTEEWRGVFHLKALEVGAAVFDCPVDITVKPTLRNRSGMPDTGACMGAAKAAIDGLVDAGVLPHDGPEVVRTLTFVAPEVTGEDSMQIEVAAVAS